MSKQPWGTTGRVFVERTSYAGYLTVVVDGKDVGCVLLSLKTGWAGDLWVPPYGRVRGMTRESTIDALLLAIYPDGQIGVHKKVTEYVQGGIDALNSAALDIYKNRVDEEGNPRLTTLEYEADRLGLPAWLNERAARLRDGEKS